MREKRGAGPAARRVWEIGASWAAGERERGMGQPGWRTGPGREKGLVGEGERAGPGCWVFDWVSVGFGLWVPFLLGFLSTSYCFSIPNSNKFEFKYKFKFKPHSIKSMHQHECTTNF